MRWLKLPISVLDIRSASANYPVRTISRRWLDAETSFSILLILFISLLSNGILLPWLGYYWDDWLFVWVGHAQGTAGLAFQKSWDRPYDGVLSSLTYTLAGDSVVGWQVLSFSLFLLSALLLLWALRNLWPKQRRMVAVVVLLYTVYPGFLGRTFAYVYHIQYIVLCLGIFSLGATIKAQRALNRPRYLAWMSLAFIFGLIYLFIYELYISLEVLRLLIIAYMSWRKGRDSLREHIIHVTKRWLPYIVFIGLFFIWRAFFYQSTRDVTNISAVADKYTTNLASQLVRVPAEVAVDFLETTLFAWVVPVEHGFVEASRPMATLSLFVGGLALLGIAFYVWHYPVDSAELPHRQRGSAWGRDTIVIGIVAAFLALLPTVLADRDVRLLELRDRFTLPALVATSILVAGVIYAVVAPRLRAWVLAVLVGLSVTAHFHNANFYRNVWADEMNFWWQMSWRVPDLKPETVIVVGVRGYAYYPEEGYDYEVWSPAQFIYAPEVSEPVIYGTRLTEEVVQRMELGQTLRYTVLADIQYDMDFDHALIVTLPTEKACMRVVQARGDELPLDQESIIRLAAPYSQVDQIITDAPNPVPPRQVFGDEPAHTWCYYFQSADLARQRGDWEQVVRLGDEAMRRGFAPKDRSEWLPFIQGYAAVGQCDVARELAEKAQKALPLLGDDVLPAACT